MIKLFGGRTVALAWVLGTVGCVGTYPESLVPQDPEGPELEGMPTVAVSGRIDVDTVWTADTVWLMDGPVVVGPGAELDIEPGTLILADVMGALIVERGGTLHAAGTYSEPIRFTSAAEEPLPGDWGGIALLGNAPVNVGEGELRSFPGVQADFRFGGDAAGSSCGVVQFVEIAYAGHEAALARAPGGLTMAGCGDATLARQIHVHESFGDGISMYGGTASVCNAAVTGPGDDGLDWQMGWTGLGQFIVVQFTGTRGDNALEGDNLDADPSATPVSSPALYNVTLLASDVEVPRRGVLLREGTSAEIGNFLAVGFGLELLDVRDAATVDHAVMGSLSMAHGAVWEIGPDGYTLSDDQLEDDDGGFDESDWLLDAHVVLEQQTGLDRRAFEERNPLWVPAVLPVVENGGPVPDAEFFMEAATWLGAVEPGTLEPFYAWMQFD